MAVYATIFSHRLLYGEQRREATRSRRNERCRLSGSRCIASFKASCGANSRDERRLEPRFRATESMQKCHQSTTIVCRVYSRQNQSSPPYEQIEIGKILRERASRAIRRLLARARFLSGEQRAATLQHRCRLFCSFMSSAFIATLRCFGPATPSHIASCR